ncbi:MAG: 2Fe-2S iron-sulfur cluster binding domain-containing protein [Saprospiraceae bacterium]|nr:2Fe-2S iron-sulfur cluster binding domain-containing protein [Saprospiraceae bacterium]
MAEFHLLKVKMVIEESKDATTIVFDVPADLEQLYRFKPGQYLTLEYEEAGNLVTRMYSISSAPYEQKLSVTIKTKSPDTLSNHRDQILKQGAVIKVSPPRGMFTVKINPDKRAAYYFLGAGSGIVPLYSMMKSILEQEPLSTVHLLYGNRSYNDIIFRDALIDLNETYSGQFFLRFQLSQEGNRPLINTNRVIGRIDMKIIQRFLEDYPKQANTAFYFISGPQDMIHTTQQTLVEMGIHKNDIFVERNNNNTDLNKIETDISMVNSCKAHITLDGNEIDIEIKEQTILQTLLDAGYDPPFSCTSGVCTTCMAKLSKGSVEMEENYGLDEDEVADGFILTCQSHPTSDEIELSYDV